MSHWTGLPLQCTGCFSQKVVMNREFNNFHYFLINRMENKPGLQNLLQLVKKNRENLIFAFVKLHTVELFSGYPLDTRRTPSWPKLRKPFLTRKGQKKMKFKLFFAFCNLIGLSSLGKFIKGFRLFKDNWNALKSPNENELAKFKVFCTTKLGFWIKLDWYKAIFFLVWRSISLKTETLSLNFLNLKSVKR